MAAWAAGKGSVPPGPIHAPPRPPACGDGRPPHSSFSLRHCVPSSSCTSGPHLSSGSAAVPPPPPCAGKAGQVPGPGPSPPSQGQVGRCGICWLEAAGAGVPAADRAPPPAVPLRPLHHHGGGGGGREARRAAEAWKGSLQLSGGGHCRAEEQCPPGTRAGRGLRWGRWAGPAWGVVGRPPWELPLAGRRLDLEQAQNPRVSEKMSTRTPTQSCRRRRLSRHTENLPSERGARWGLGVGAVWDHTHAHSSRPPPPPASFGPLAGASTRSRSQEQCQGLGGWSSGPWQAGDPQPEAAPAGPPTGRC